MHQLMLRKIPERVEKGLRQRAKASGLSVNKAVIQLLSDSLGVSRPAVFGRKRDLSALSGTWSKKDVAVFKKATAQLEKIDPELWR